MPHETAKLRARSIVNRALALKTSDPQLSEFFLHLAEAYDDQARQRKEALDLNRTDR